jgi:SAM-dependent methyltransferase
VIRNWARLDSQIAGSDLSGGAIDWCRDNLPFARFETNGLSPPLAFADASFDLTYALSVLTHLPEAIQHDWMEELHRVARPGGFVLLTTHGERYLERLDDGERERFRAGQLVVRWGEVPGTNLCTTFHPPAWVRERLLPHGFEEVSFVPEGAAGNPYQDLFLLRRAT